MDVTREEQRLRDARTGVPWRFWGPYLSERQWGTVREDYSDNGDAWSYFSHDQARSRAYRWGEDGMAGISDEQQRLCFALALWNEQDAIVKERLFGLTNSEGNHGEDVKEYYFFVDNLPTHSYQRWQYKYPQRPYPYADLVETNRGRSRLEMEYELLDTGVFDDDRYFDVEVTYAKAGPHDLLCRIDVHNRGPEDAPIHLLPTLWFRNTWTYQPHTAEPTIERVDGRTVVRAAHDTLGVMYLYAPDGADLLFCDNESNAARLWGQTDSPPFPKDGIVDHVVHGAATVNPAGRGTKAAAHVRLVVPAGSSTGTWLRLTSEAPETLADPFAGADDVVAAKRAEADEFYAALTPPGVSDDAASVLRQALAGMLWSKQSYYFDVDVWLQEHQSHPMRHPQRRGVRNEAWFHMINHDVISMPDTWEYPWYAAWDLAFHCLPLAMVDPDFAQSQLDLMLSQVYLHPTGQIPAYEWNFGDVNPPVHAFATLFMYSLSGHLGEVDLPFLRQSFTRLLLNFTWWVNRKDPDGKNVFEGGFLGLDNIGVFDRSAALPTGGRLEQADGTGWMALFSQNMLELALALVDDDPDYADFVFKFVEHFFWIAAAVDPIGDHPDEMWDDEDGFFYDVLRRPDGTGERLKVRSLVGLLPLCATTVIEEDVLRRYPELAARVRSYLERNHDLLVNIADPLVPGVKGRRLLSLVNEEKLRRMLTRMLDEDRFLGPHGIRSISRIHLDEPYEVVVEGVTYRVQYEPAESTTGMFGGNSNWRGPVWFPVNLLIIRALIQHYRYYGDDFTIECPTGSGVEITLFEVARELARRLTATFLRDTDGRRPVYGGTERFQNDPHWRDLILFYEYFHGDNGAGLGASHQTGWTGLVAPLIQLFGHLEASDVLDRERPFSSPFRRVTGESIAPVATAREARGSPSVRLPANPLVHEIFTWVWLHDISASAGRAVTLGDVPDDAWDEVAGDGVDAIWLMGVWERSPAGAAIARTHPAMSSAQRATLPDVADDDVVGSAYCIRNYRVDDHLGGPAGLVAARQALASRGVGLILDFVPNHVAPDHPWVDEHPEYFVREDDGTIALGRDPYFPPWPEVLQLDASLSAVRHAATEVVTGIAEQCDGVRCDMAMLVLDDVFVRTWGDRALGGPSPEGGRGYWPTVIDAVRVAHPGFTFWAEAYWDLEPVLVAQGFDACYDKRLYDRLVHGEPAGAVRDHLRADPAYQAHTVRFVENHDEPRLAAVLTPPQDRAAATVAMTLPGVALLHEGQSVGRRVRVPVTLGRRPAEPTDGERNEWYGRLLTALGGGLRRGAWALVDVDGWPDNRSCEQLVAWTWSSPDATHLVVVNLGEGRADGVVRLPAVRGGPLTMVDVLSGERFERDGGAIGRDGLYVALPGYGVHVLGW